jgi:hypothetical protein
LAHRKRDGDQPRHGASMLGAIGGLTSGGPLHFFNQPFDRAACNAVLRKAMLLPSTDSRLIDAKPLCKAGLALAEGFTD